MAAPTSPARNSRKGEILETFTEMVAARGYDAVSIRDVAESLSMSKGTILHHFSSKDQLLEKVHANYMSRRLQEADAILEQIDGPAEQLTALIYQNMFAMRYDHAATVAFAREIVRFASEETMRDVREMRRQYSKRMRDIIARGMDEGLFHRENPTIVSLQIFGMFNWSWTWLRSEGELTIEEIAGTFVRTMLRGLATSDEARDVASDNRIRETVRAAMADVISNKKSP